MYQNKNFVLDCDTGRDDALAIELFFKLGLPLRAVVSTFGNVGIDHVINNNLRLLSFLKQHIPVFKGAERPEKLSVFYDEIVLKRHRTLGNGMSDVILPETDKIISKDHVEDWIRNFVRDNGKIHYVVTGPATTLSLILDALENPSAYIEKITMMGGKFDPLWAKLSNGPDFNIGADPEAFEKILNSGIETAIIPMNTTFPICISLEQIKLLVPKTVTAEMFKEVMLQHLLKFAPEPFFRFHDPMVPVLLYDSNPFIETKTLKLHVESSDIKEFARLIESKEGVKISVYGDVSSPDHMLSKIIALLGFEELPN